MRFRGSWGVRAAVWAFIQRHAVTCVVMALITMAGNSLAAAAGTVSVAATAASAGATAGAPVLLQVPPGAEVATLQFNLTAVPLGAAPALDAAVTFTPGLPAPRPAPNFNQNEGNETVLVGWLQEISPHLSGQVQLGTVNVPIPAGARAGDRYTVDVRSPSATSDGVTEVPLTGVAGEMEVAGTACVGDCNASMNVTIDEVLTMVNLALGGAHVTDCTAGDANGDYEISVDEILTAVNNALHGCGPG